MAEFKQALINKNRGWRGLAEIIIYNDKHEIQNKTIFSFSQTIWEDLIIAHTIVIQDDKYYYIVKFNNDDCAKELPRQDQQRSVLIKNAELKIDSVSKVKKNEWRSAEAFNWSMILHFTKNSNNHTTSDWNCIGVRVVPTI